VIGRSSLPDSVLVVGAGPARATAARALARAGVPVRLLDRAVFPRNKPCGGGISLRMLRRFPYLERELARIATHTVGRLYLEGPDGESTVIESDGPAALMIRRVEFDALLVSLAREAGADLMSGVDIVRAREERDGVRLFARDGRTFTAPIVIAADGVHSIVARRLGLNPGWTAAAVALDMMEETPRTQLRDLDPSTMWVSYGCNLEGRTPVEGKHAPPGYAYVFPKKDHVNIGVGYVLSHYRQAIGESPYSLQQNLVRRLRDRGRVNGESVRKNFTPFLIPVGGPLRRPGRGRVLLAGDAGGFVNGFTAEGIYYAMVSGERAASAVVEAPSDVTGLAERYRRACDDEIGAELRDAVLLQRYLFADRRRITRMITGAGREAATTRIVLDWLVGRVPYRRARRAVVGRAPLVAARLAWSAMAANRLFRPHASR
jgi:geranylgeranyl reductase family protein